MKKIIASIILGIPYVGVAWANPESEWKGEAEVGAVLTSGNTETQNVNAKAKLVNERDKWKHTAKLEIMSSSSDSETTAERYFASGKSDYKLSDKNYLYGLITYENDRFSGYDYRTNESLGYGRHLIKRDNLTLDAEAGAGARQSKLRTGSSENEGVFRLAGALNWKISAASIFSEDLSFDIGENQTVSKSVTGLKTQIVGSLATKITYTVKNTSDVPPGVKTTDTETAVTLVYSF